MYIYIYIHIYKYIDTYTYVIDTYIHIHIYVYTHSQPRAPQVTGRVVARHVTAVCLRDSELVHSPPSTLNEQDAEELEAWIDAIKDAKRCNDERIAQECYTSTTQLTSPSLTPSLYIYTYLYIYICIRK